MALKMHFRYMLRLVLGIFLILQQSQACASAQDEPTPFTLEVLKETAAESKGFIDEFDAAVWMVSMDARLQRYIKDKEIREKILIAAHREASRYELDPQIVLAVMHVESLFDNFAISSVGAQGIMQIMPFWKKEIHETQANLFEINTNIRFGCLILKTYLKIEKGNMFRALGRYNGSLGKPEYPEKVFSRLEKYWMFN